MDENAGRAQPWDARQVMYEALITSAISSARRAEEIGLHGDQIVLSCKVSAVQDLISVYQALATRCDYALHLGLTEAGMGTKGAVASTAALSVLLQQGIGDTIRISLTPQPGESRTQEVLVGLEILQALGLRTFVPAVTACPGCGRTTSTTFQELAKQIDDYLRASMPVWRERYPGVENLKVAVMGCNRQWTGREQACRHRHQPARHRRSPGSTGLHRRAESPDPARRGHRPRIPDHRRQLHRKRFGAAA